MNKSKAAMAGGLLSMILSGCTGAVISETSSSPPPDGKLFPKPELDTPSETGSAKKNQPQSPLDNLDDDSWGGGSSDSDDHL